MKLLLSCFLCFFLTRSEAQPNQSAPNIFIITTDGFRWQEIFNGADSLIINNPAYVKDTALLNQMYWDNDVNERRRMLMPFVWQTLAKKGSLYGNRNYGNKVSLANSYRFSYAGYNEILTGYADPYITSNSKKWNSNENLLEFLNTRPGYQNKVAAFTSWNLFEYILNRKQGNIYLNNGYEAIKQDSLTATEILFNAVQENGVFNFGSTRNDMLTFVAAKEYIQKNHPKVVFIGFGETDEYAHGGHYDEYLQSAHQFDAYLARLWYLVNKDPFYKNNTSFIITTDHGRGKKSNTWKRHDLVTAGSGSSWLMTIGPELESNGEVKVKSEIFSNQLAKTIAGIAGYAFNPLHPAGDALSTSAINKNGNTGLTKD